MRHTRTTLVLLAAGAPATTASGDGATGGGGRGGYGRDGYGDQVGG